MADSQRRQLAEIISIVFHPGLLTIVSLALVTNHFAQTSQQFYNWTIYGSLLIVGPGVLYAIGLSWKERKVDLDISRRQDRIVPLILASLGALIGGYLIDRHLDIPTLKILGNVLVAVLIVLTFITMVWKISLHTTTLATLVTVLVIFRGPIFSLCYLAILPVGWSRMVLKQHTLAQLVGGSLAGIAVPYLAYWVFRS